MIYDALVALVLLSPVLLLGIVGELDRLACWLYNGRHKMTKRERRRLARHTEANKRGV